ncbi:MAG TPA: hypothetical protein VJ508_10745, partial [Saprospiraceae bacterium]|nr:hypothetical protein [Saprospiraceae bacterium]
MDEPLTRERIDRYLLGKANPEDLAWVRRKIDEDPAFAAAIQESEAAVQVIRTARYQELRKRLNDWDELAST